MAILPVMKALLSGETALKNVLSGSNRRQLYSYASLAGTATAALLLGASLDEGAQERRPSRGLRIDLPAKLAYLGDEELSLTRTEFNLLLFFAHNTGRVLRHDDILRAVWGQQYGNDTQILRTYV